MIRCENLSAGYGGKNVIENITWEGKCGSLTVLIGPNGCGKSTLLKALAGQLRPGSGEVSLEGRPLKEWQTKELAQRIAYLPQSRSDANISVFRMVLHGRFPYIVYPRHYTKEDEARVTEALEKMGIAGLGERVVSELSGGQKQKAYLAMALVQETGVLLLDEPTTYLDISCQLELLELLYELKREGKTVIMVLHDLNHALRYADEILLMKEGRLVEAGTPEEILQSGRLEEIFHVHSSSLKDEEGNTHYVFSAMGRKV